VGAQTRFTIVACVVAGGVVNECVCAVGGVAAAGCVADERVRTVGRVEVAGCVAIERTKTHCRVVQSGCEAEEGPLSLSCVAVAQVSVRLYFCLSGRRKRKAGERNCAEKETAPQRRSADRISFG